jgi:hypothetical protein
MSKLVWKKTGDHIDLVPINHKVYDFFVDNLNANHANQYAMADLGFEKSQQELLILFDQFRIFVSTKLKSNLIDFDLDPSNQDDLNRLHRTWVKIHQTYPNIGRLFDNSILYKINKLIHKIEDLCQNFSIATAKPDLIFENPFDTKILQHGRFHVNVEYNNLGRTSYNKWCQGDSVKDTDTNNFDEMYTELTIKCRPSETYELPVDYQSWCKKYNINCVGSCLPLANFDNYEINVLKYKQLILTNSLVTDNFIILE